MVANSIFSGPITSIFNSVRFDGDPYTCQFEEDDKKVSGFHISQFYGSFVNYIMAVMGLKGKKKAGRRGNDLSTSSSFFSSSLTPSLPRCHLKMTH